MEKIFLYNTLTRKKEEFKPLKKGVVGFYYCGPTVYWTQHIGNLRGAFCADIIRRVFEYDGYKVKFVKNYTDVGHLVSDEDAGEDKMEKGAKREGLTPKEIAQKYIDIYEQDVAELNVQKPWKSPRATRHIKEMQAMIKTLLEKRVAYSTPLAIYFDVAKFPTYTELSRQNLEKNIIGEGSGDVTDPNKKHARDFALWFFRAGTHNTALQFWQSPFKSPLVKNGEGFPGWHIECSAMSKKYLGPTLDIHMGGIEHIPVHHTNEIAQSESANGVKYVNYWLHNEHLLVNDEKMAKSTGTGFTLAEVKEKGFSPLALRYYFLSANYRSKQNFTWEALEAAQNGLNSIYNKIRELKSHQKIMTPALSSSKGGVLKSAVSTEYKNKFAEFINDDFNTPGALAVLQEVLKSNLSAGDKLATILDFDRVLGLSFDKVLEKITDVKITEDVRALAMQRKKARADKNWSEADRLRAEIEAKGYIVDDTKEGVKISKK